MKRCLTVVLIVLAVAILVLVVAFPVRHAVVRYLVTKENQNPHFSKITNIGSTKRLEILPIFENTVSQEGLIAGHGVSYLVKTDRANILFDVGFDPNALQSNNQQLGDPLEGIDLVVISHNHPDHVGGVTWWTRHTFSLDDTQVDLGSLPVYVPEPMTYPGLAPVVANQPQVISPGVASMGDLAFEDFFIPSFRFIRREQALAVNVDGLGIVLISGCGHPGLKSMLDRAETLFESPVVGVVGGLHYTNKNLEDLESEVQLMQSAPLHLLAISPHDSEPAKIQVFGDAFPGIYQDIEVGRTISMAAGS